MSEPKPSYPYVVILSPEEARSAQYMSDRGYLAEIMDHVTEREINEEGNLELRFSEADAWEVHRIAESNPNDVWALTTPATSLGMKFLKFMDSLV